MGFVTAMPRLLRTSEPRRTRDQLVARRSRPLLPQDLEVGVVAVWRKIEDVAAVRTAPRSR